MHIYNRDEKSIGFTHDREHNVLIKSAVCAIVVNGRQTPFTMGHRSVESPEFYHEYMDKHCSADVSMEKSGDVISVTASDAALHSITGVVVRIIVEWDDDVNNHNIRLYEDDILIPVADNLDQSYGQVVGHLQRVGIPALAAKLRILEIRAAAATKATEEEGRLTRSRLEERLRVRWREAEAMKGTHIDLSQSAFAVEYEKEAAKILPAVRKDVEQIRQALIRNQMRVAHAHVIEEKELINSGI